MRLIDADKLHPDSIGRKGLAISQSQIANAPTVEYPEAITIKCDTEEDKQKLVSALRNASARLEVRVEEEKPTGEWKEMGYETGALGITYKQTQCSNCGWEHALPMWWNFCPNCGADMRKEAENED